MTGAEGGSTPRGGARRRLRALLLALGVVAAAGLVGWLLFAPWPRGLQAGDPGPTALMEQRMAEAREAGDSLEIRREWVPLERISSRLVRAVIVAEDHRFREHGGVDWTALAEEVEWTGGEHFSWARPSDWAALAEALRYVWTHRDEIRGRSTITQQLAKNLWFGTDRSFVRKVREMVAAQRLERRLDKDRILELYLNVVELGPGIFGVEAAARAYFGRSASDLTLAQAAALAATLPHPLTSNPARSPGRMRWRQDLILERLRGPRAQEPRPIPRPDAGPPPGVELPRPEVTPVAPPDTAPGDSTAPGGAGPGRAGGGFGGGVGGTARWARGGRGSLPALAQALRTSAVARKRGGRRWLVACS